MLCIRVSCEDEGNHILISCICEELCEISCERCGYADIWSDLIRDVSISCKDVSDHIQIYSEFVTSIDIWCSYVCHIRGWSPFIYVEPKKVFFQFNACNTIRNLAIYSNVNWGIDEKIR